ncbi:MAG: hypothetical protein GEU92_19900 [Alphaproteobacteria bacterium]|nr:hypothetical protein [Alphaproteobacteria bacterium]
MTGMTDTIAVEDGLLFARFAEAVINGPHEETSSARATLADKAGAAALVDAAAAAALFNAINRVADAIGIQFEEWRSQRTAGLRKQLRLDGMPTAR